jgi:aquaporin Z
VTCTADVFTTAGGEASIHREAPPMWEVFAAHVSPGVRPEEEHVTNVPPPPPPTGGAAPVPPAPAAPTAVAPTPPTIAELTAVGPTNLKVFAAEAVGTFVLMIIGPGSAILAGSQIGLYGVAFAFGLALLAMAYTIGHVSGCHINPAVTLSFLVARKLSLPKAIYYWVAQVVGAVLGGLVLYVLSRGGHDDTGVFAANGWGEKIGNTFGIGSAMLVEIIFTALLIFVVLSTTGKGYPAGFGGIAVGFTLAMIHLATIPVDNTSVNPARSIGTAIFGGSDALSQLWLFIVFPLIGAIVGVVVWLMVHDEKLEDTMFGQQAQVVAARDRAAGFAAQVDDRFGPKE